MKAFLASLFVGLVLGFFSVTCIEFKALILQLILCSSKPVPFYSPSDSKGWGQGARVRVDDRALS